MSHAAWRSVIDAWRRGGGREVLDGIRGRAELRRLTALSPDEAYRNWLSRNEYLWTRHAHRDSTEVVRVLRSGSEFAAPHESPDPSGFVVGLRATDTLRPGALHLLGCAIRDGADVAYADEDCETEAGPGQPFLKPAWSDILSLSLPGAFPGRPTAIANRLWNRLVQDTPRQTWTEYVLRATEQADRIAHIPLPLATCGVIREAEDGWFGPSEPDLEAIDAALRRRGIAAVAEPGATPGTVRLRPNASDQRVSVLVPTRDRPDLLDSLADALERECSFQPLERIWLDHATVNPQARTRLEAESQRPHSQVLRFDGEFNFSRMINAGAQAATGRHLLLLNNDIEPTSDGWIRDLAAAASLPDVHAVGPLLLYPGGEVQHAGIGLGIGTVSGHPYRGMTAESTCFTTGPLVARDVSALTGACLLVSREEFQAVDGLDERDLPVSFSDVDLCLKLCRRGGQILYDPAIRLVHHETVSRSPVLDPAEVRVMRSRWRKELRTDPHLPPALSRLSEHPLLASGIESAEPRVWKRR